MNPRLMILLISKTRISVTSTKWSCWIDLQILTVFLSEAIHGSMFQNSRRGVQRSLNAYRIFMAFQCN